MVFLLVDFPVTRCYILLFLSSKLMILEKCLILEIVPAGGGPSYIILRPMQLCPRTNGQQPQIPRTGLQGLHQECLGIKANKNELPIQHAGRRIAAVFAVVF